MNNLGKLNNLQTLFSTVGNTCVHLTSQLMPIIDNCRLSNYADLRVDRQYLSVTFPRDGFNGKAGNGALDNQRTSGYADHFGHFPDVRQAVDVDARTMRHFTHAVIGRARVLAAIFRFDIGDVQVRDYVVLYGDVLPCCQCLNQFNFYEFKLSVERCTNNKSGFSWYRETVQSPCKLWWRISRCNAL